MYLNYKPLDAPNYMFLSFSQCKSKELVSTNLFTWPD